MQRWGPTDRDKDCRQVSGEGRVASLLDAVQVQPLPHGFLNLKGAVRLQLQRVVGPQLHFVGLRQVASPQPDLCPYTASATIFDTVPPDTFAVQRHSNMKSNS